VTRVHIRWERRPSRPVADQLRGVVSGCLKDLGPEDAEIHIVLTDDQTVRRLNHRFLGVDRATDVLSFPDGDEFPSGRIFLGEIVISLDSARRQAEDLGHGELRELCELALHGTLHLLGYDHERDNGKMDEIELQLRRELLP
jgi:probable rRNA maturation factor